jgi:acetyl esterase/lipase
VERSGCGISKFTQAAKVMKRITYHITLFGVIFTLVAQATIKPDRIEVYKQTRQGDLSLHIFEPPHDLKHKSAPAIVFFFGGGWAGGTPKQFYQQAVEFSSKGFMAFSAEYRVSGTHKTSPFECVEDGKSAVRWVRENAETLGIDPNRIVSAGGSAGGHVAACTGTIKGYEAGNIEISSVPNAMILYNPVIDTTENGFGIKKVGFARKTQISPCHHVKRGIPPTLIFHGKEDSVVPYENVERFTRLMKKSGNSCTLVGFENKKHGFFNGSFFRASSDDKDFHKSMKESFRFLHRLQFI